MPKSPDPISSVQQFQFQMSDDALVTFDLKHMKGSVAPFHDVGFMPLDAASVAGTPLAGLTAGLGGMFLQYVGDGTQDFATGAITYKSLHYELVGYTGNATFLPATSPTQPPTVTGIANQVVLAQGDLLKNQGNLFFTGGVVGEVDASVKIGGKTVGALDIHVDHPAGDVGGFAPPTGAPPAALTLYGGTLQATFVPLSS